MSDHMMPPTPAWDDPALLEASDEPVAYAGDHLESGTQIADKESVADAIRTVYDPEIPVNIYELGLIYELEIAEDGSVDIKMTLTSPGCPVAGILPQQVADAAASVPGVGRVKVILTWDPPWTMDAMSDEAKVALGLY